MTESTVGAWIGEIPNYLKAFREADSNNENKFIDSAVLENSDVNVSLQDIASYQVNLLLWL